jgi:tetratricopeptide (TPR) repeat protein
LGFFSYVSPHDAFPKAKAAAKKALAIDPGLAEARFSMAHCSFYYEWNWEEAERRYRRAIELAPREPTGRQKYGFFLAAMGHYDEALKQLEIAQEVDPLSHFYATSAAIVLLHARRPEKGIEICRQVLDDNPKDAWTRWVLAWHLQMLGEFVTAVSEARTAFVDSRENSHFLAVLGHAYGLNGQRDEAQIVLEQLEERKPRSHTSPFLLALVCAGLGQKDDAFQYLNEAFDERTGWMVWLRSYPPLDTICEDPRYKDISSRVGLD